MKKKSGLKPYFIFKRCFDIISSSMAILFLPIFIIIIKLLYIITGDFHSIFYVQKRIGKNGKEFNLIKFRTMIKNADKSHLEELLKDPNIKKEWKDNHKLENDPRITKVGKILRKTSLDELPQFLNIFIGQMSLIGPRPLAVGELESYHGNEKIYNSIRPGLTGWWGCNGRSEILSNKKRLELEYFYVKNISLCLDIKCFFKTIIAVFQKKGAK